MRHTREYVAFYAQRYAAGQRGITWDFTFEEWCKWWTKNLGPNWMTLRGCKRGQFVMARKGDKGSYHKSNVVCITTTQNGRDKGPNGSALRGESHGCVKLTEAEAIKIRKAKGTLYEIAERFKISPDTVRRIKEGSLWKHLTTSIQDFTRVKAWGKRLTDKEVIAIFQAVGTAKELAIRFGTSPSNVGLIKTKRSRAEITSKLASVRQKDHRKKLTDEQVRTIFLDARDRHTLAKEYGVAPITIWEIKHRTKRTRTTEGLK